MALSLFNAVYNYIAADAGLADLVGDRVWQSLSRDETFPLIVVDVEPEQDTGLTRKPKQTYSVIFTIVATSEAERDEVSQSLIDLFHLSAWKDNNVDVGSCVFEGSTTDALSDNGDADRIYYETRATFTFKASV